MKILVGIKRVPAVAGRITLTEDDRAIDSKYLGFAIGPHEECAVEAAIQLVEASGGESVVLTLGPDRVASNSSATPWRWASRVRSTS